MDEMCVYVLLALIIPIAFVRLGEKIGPPLSPPTEIGMLVSR
jgi:hypothetical protein